MLSLKCCTSRHPTATGPLTEAWFGETDLHLTEACMQFHKEDSAYLIVLENSKHDARHGLLSKKLPPYRTPDLHDVEIDSTPQAACLSGQHLLHTRRISFAPKRPSQLYVTLPQTAHAFCLKSPPQHPGNEVRPQVVRFLMPFTCRGKTPLPRSQAQSLWNWRHLLPEISWIGQRQPQ